MIILSEKISKSDINTAAKTISNEVLDGNLDPIKTLVQLKALEAACGQAIKDIQEEAISESYKHPGKSLIMLGATVTKKEGSLLLDFDQDAVYANIKKQIKEREEQLKTAYQMNKKGDVYVASDGEQVPVVPPKPTKSSLAVLFKPE
jgi:hypothetical protein